MIQLQYGVELELSQVASSLSYLVQKRQVETEKVGGIRYQSIHSLYSKQGFLHKKKARNKVSLG